MNLIGRVVAGLLVLSGAVGMAKAEQDWSETAVSNTLDAFHSAASAADLEGYLGLLTDDMVFLGTDGTERWQGQSFRDFVTEHFSVGRGWTYVTTERHIELAEGGRWAYFDELLQHDKLGQCRGSGVLVLQEGEWKVAQYNLSVPVPNDMVLEVAEDIRRQSQVSEEQ